jgi:ABC-type antimicrobial peptide transport system permease subunit
MNLATARSGNRAKEIGMRKVSGAYKTDIIKQFFGESILFSLISLVFALIIVWLLLPAFSNLAAKDLSMDISGNLPVLLGLLCIALMTGIISGSYPAFFLSAFQPVNVLKGTLKSGSKGSAFRKILVVIQFSLTILLIICTTFVYNQLNYMRNRKIGYEKENMIYFGMRKEIKEKYESVKNELLQDPNILGVTASSNVPTYGYSFSNSMWRWEGQNPEEETLMRAVFINDDYFETFGMEIVEGRSYSKEFSTDVSEAIMVNEAAVKAMGMESPVGQRLSISDSNFTIIGVVKNYHFRSLRQEIGPLILIYNADASGVLFARLKSDDIPKTIGYIEKVWKKFAPGYPFNYRFLDDALDRLYRSEQRIGTILKYFAILAIFISCLGLFGLASFMAEQRTKEIGIRKILGARVSNIVLLLSKEFTKWVLMSNIIACPMAYYAMKKWLQSYAYSINIVIWPFLLSATLAFVIALCAVSFQAFKAATANPVESLRYE